MGGNVGNIARTSGKGPAGEVVPPSAPGFAGAGALANAASNIANALRQTSETLPTTSLGAVPTPPSPPPPPQSPLVQQMMARPPVQQFNPMQAYAPQMGQPRVSGLPMALAMLRGQFNQMMAPQQQRPMMPMPTYRAPALNYRPNMASAQQSLGRVAVSVAEQQRRAAQAEADRLRAENEALQDQQRYYGSLQSYYDYGGGG